MNEYFSSVDMKLLEKAACSPHQATIRSCLVVKLIFSQTVVFKFLFGYESNKRDKTC